VLQISELFAVKRVNKLKI